VFGSVRFGSVRFTQTFGLLTSAKYELKKLWTGGCALSVHAASFCTPSALSVLVAPLSRV
jgi:hypothetical protein